MKLFTGVVFAVLAFVTAEESCQSYAEGNVYPDGGSKGAESHNLHVSKAQSKSSRTSINICLLVHVRCYELFIFLVQNRSRALHP